MKRKHDLLPEHLRYLKLDYVQQYYESIAGEAAEKGFTHVEYLRRLLAGEAALRYERSVQRKIKRARLPVLKTLDQFDWSWPSKINRQQVRDLFRLRFIDQKANVVFCGGVGLGKTHLAIALTHPACMDNCSTLFASAIDIINNLSAAQAVNNLPKELKKYSLPRLLVIDELGFLPMDKRAADLLFQVISNRYERGSIIITTNTIYKRWPRIFNNDATITSAVLDRLLHHCETVTIQGKSFRMKDND